MPIISTVFQQSGVLSTQGIFSETEIILTRTRICFCLNISGRLNLRKTLFKPFTALSVRHHKAKELSSNGRVNLVSFFRDVRLCASVFSPIQFTHLTPNINPLMTKKFYSMTRRLNVLSTVLAALSFLYLSPEIRAQGAMQLVVDARLAEGRQFKQQVLFESRTERSSDVRSKYGIAPEVLFEGTVVHPASGQRSALLVAQPQFAAFEIPTGEGDPLVLQVFRKSPFSPDVSLQDGRIDADAFATEAAFYRGVVEGHKGSLASLTVTADEIRAMVAFNGNTYVLGKIKDAEDGAHIFYRSDDLALPENFSCEVLGDEVKEAPANSMAPEASSRTVKCVRIRVEIDNGLTANLGGEAPAIAYTAGLWNEVTTLYDNDGIDITVSEIFAWNGSSPYSGSLSNRLNQLNKTSLNADLTALITNVGGGGIAYISTVCSSTFGTSVSNVFGVYQSVPTYSWDVQVCAHEIGHNLSSRHTHACVWNGNNTPLDGCGIAVGFLEGNCGTAPIPTNGGTIMSYCHLSAAGISFTQGFGDQPSTRMINYINSRSCLGSSCASPAEEEEEEEDVCVDELVTLEISHDGPPSATSWEVADDNGDIVESGGPYTATLGGTVFTGDLCLPAGCHTLTVFSETSNATYTLTAADGTVVSSGSEFSDSETTAVCSGDPEAEVNCTDPYPKVQNVTATVEDGGVMVNWTPIPGSLGCMLQGGRAGSSAMITATIMVSDASSYFIPSGEFPANGSFRVRVRCGCSRNPSVIGDWGDFVMFSWTNSGGMPPEAQGLFADMKMTVSTFPNPTTGEISLAVTSGTEEALVLRIFDLPGRLVHSERIQAAPGDNLFRLDLSNLGEAVYLLQLTGEHGSVLTSRIVVSK